MQAIIQTGSHQFKVAQGDTIEVELLGIEKGGEVRFDDVRLLMGKGEPQIGTPRVAGAVVVGQVLDVVKGPKLRNVKFRRRKDSKVTKGHRQKYHKVRITAIEVK